MKKMLTDERALVQVCGNESAMGKEVMEALQKTGVIENDQALQDMKMKGKILMELWGEWSINRTIEEQYWFMDWINQFQKLIFS